MAKSKSKEFSFSDIGNLAKSIAKSKNLSIEISDKKKGEKKELLPTGIYALDGLLSGSILNGGIQSNRITVFAGDSGVGKSFLCYNIAREAQKKGWNVIYIDTEFSIEEDQLETFGIDISSERFMLIRNNIVEEIKMMLTQLLDGIKEQKKAGKDIAKTIIFLDSAGQLASRKEVEDAKAGSEKADMTRAKSMASLFRIINSDLGYLNIPMVVTNHTYSSMDLFPQEIMKGGKSLYYTASTIVMLSKAKLKTGDEDETDLGQSGIIVTAKTVKNRLAKPKKVKFELSFRTGSNPYSFLEGFCSYEKVGIGQGKLEVDKETGEMVWNNGAGNRWYIDHLQKSVFTKQLHTKEIFTPEVLQKIEPIVADHFKFKSQAEIEAHEKEMEELDKAAGKSSDDDKDVDEVSAEDLFD